MLWTCERGIASMRLCMKKSTSVQPTRMHRDPGTHTSACLGYGAFVHPKQQELADVERHPPVRRGRRRR
eukprot:4760725-Alexandrium_andersonii.AAC.1